MSESRFQFLEDDFPKLYDKCSQAEQAAGYDVTMLKVRQALEYMVKAFGMNNHELFQDINELEGKGLLDSDMSHRFHEVRRMANYAIHDNPEFEQAQTKKSLDDLLILTLWFGITKGKNYSLDQFQPTDVLAVRKYLTKNGDIPATPDKEIKSSAPSIDPLSVVGGFEMPEAPEIDPLERDVFETQAEYEQRIADMDPVHIGYAILDPRRNDGYTKVNFLMHHIDRNPHIKFAGISAFYTDASNVDAIIDDEMVACLKVHEKQICCDYDRIYLRNGKELLPVHPIYWQNLPYETDDEFQKRIQTMPLMPFGIGIPLRSQYNIETKELPFQIRPFMYTKEILRLLISREKNIVIQCNPSKAKSICNYNKPCVLFIKLDQISCISKLIIWRQDIGIIHTYDLYSLIKKAAISGDINAQYRLGNYYYERETVNDHAIAIKWWRKASDQGSEQALKKLKDVYQKKAEQGNANAQYELGNCYYYGKGIPEDTTKAIGWWEKASNQGNEKALKKLVEWCQKKADRGDIIAQYELGNYYYYGKGINKNQNKAIEWWGKAGDNGNVHAKKRLFDLYKKLAINGDADAQYKLALCYHYGDGVKINYERAIEWYKKAIIQGNLEAETNLLKIDTKYKENVEEINERNKIRLLKEEALKGNTDAQYNIGNYYYFNHNEDSNYNKAVYWWKKASEQGNADAQYKLGICYYYGQGITKSIENAITCWEKASDRGNKKAKERLIETYEDYAEKGNANAQYQLGLFYIYGIYVKVDYDKAMKLLNKSSLQGNKAAQEMINKWCWKAAITGSVTAQKILKNSNFAHGKHPVCLDKSA